MSNVNELPYRQLLYKSLFFCGGYTARSYCFSFTRISFGKQEKTKKNNNPKTKLMQSDHKKTNIAAKCLAELNFNMFLLCNI